MKHVSWLAGLVVATAGAASAAGVPVTIENEFLKIAADPATGVFSVTEKAGGHVVLNDGRWEAGPAPARRQPAGWARSGERAAS